MGQQQQQAQQDSSNQSVSYDNEAFNAAIQQEFERIVKEIEDSALDLPLKHCIRALRSL